VGKRENGLNAAENLENMENQENANTENLENTENHFCTLTDDEIDKMLVKLLRGELKKLGLLLCGKKSDLIRRLKEGRDGKVKYRSTAAAAPKTGGGEAEEERGERKQLINLGFSAAAKWVKLTKDINGGSLEDELIIDGKKYCSPTVPQDEFVKTGNGAGTQKKYNYSVKFACPSFLMHAHVLKTHLHTQAPLKDRNGKCIYEVKKLRKQCQTWILLRRISYMKTVTLQNGLMLFCQRRN